MSLIHPTAVIHPQARIAPDVRIGPYVVVDGPATIGPGCEIAAHAILTGHVTLGAHNRVGHGALLGADPQDNAFDPATESRVVIGDNNRIREYVTLHRGTAPGSETRVGNGCFLMAGAHLGHNARIGNGVILANNVLLGGHVQVEDHVFIGGGSVFHQFVRVGRNAIVQGLSGMSKDIPPFLMGCRINHVAGLNVIGLRRAGFSPAQRQEIKEAYQLLYHRGHNTTQALAAAQKREWGAEATAFFAFVAEAKKRGICSFLGNRTGGEEREG